MQYHCLFLWLLLLFDRLLFFRGQSIVLVLCGYVWKLAGMILPKHIPTKEIVLKKILCAVLLPLLCAVACSKKTTEPAQSSSEAAGKAVLNAALLVSELDVSALAAITEKMKSACARNKYGLSEAACVEVLERRKDVCLQQTAQKYPGQLANVDRMQEVVASHVACLFEK